VESATKRNFLIAFVLLAIPVSFALVSRFSANSCDGSVGKVSIILDYTDPVSSAAREATVLSIMKYLERVPEFTSVVIRYVEDDQPKFPPVKLCREILPVPTTGITKNEKAVKETWDRLREDIRASVEQPAKSSRFSPIFETVLDSLRGDFVGVGRERHLLLFSDLQYYNRSGSINFTNGNCQRRSGDRVRMIYDDLPILRGDRPLSGFSASLFLYPREGTHKTELNCLVASSDGVFNLLSDVNTRLEPILTMPVSP